MAAAVPKRTMDDSDIKALEAELETEQQKCHAAADKAIPLAQKLRTATTNTGKFRVKTPSDGVKLPVKTPFDTQAGEQSPVAGGL